MAKEQKGITLMALVITIIVLLILASISINMISGDNSLINNASKAKESSEVAEEREILDISTTQSMGKNKYGILAEGQLQEFLNTNSNGKAKIIDEDEESFIVKFEDSNRYYTISKTGEVSYIETDGKEKYLTVQCVNSEGTVLAEKQYLIIRDTYSKKPLPVDDYEIAQEGNLIGEITESKTIQVLYYKILNDDTELVFTGLDSSGNITEDESAIESYMIGTGNGTYGNGVQSSLKTVKSVLYIPETYKGKTITKLGRFSIGRTYVVKAVLPDNIQVIGDSSLKGLTYLELVVLGKSLNKIEVNSFSDNPNLEKIVFRCEQFTSGMTTYFPKGRSIKSFILDGNEQFFKAEEDVLYSKDGKILYLALASKNGTFTIPSSVTTIFDYSFSNSKLTSIVVPDSVTSIHNEAFLRSSIKEIVIGQNVTSILGYRAFVRC